MIALGKHRQVDVLQVDDVDVEVCVRARALDEPVGDGTTDASFAHAGDHHA